MRRSTTLPLSPLTRSLLPTAATPRPCSRAKILSVLSRIVHLILLPNRDPPLYGKDGGGGARVASRRATRSNWWRSVAAATAIASTATTTTLSTIINIFDGCVESVTNGLSSNTSDALKVRMPLLSGYDFSIYKSKWVKPHLALPMLSLLSSSSSSS